MPHSPYILVTAARNEASHILETLRSVTEQTLLPHHWIIVSDGSTDETPQIVDRYSTEYPFIELLRVEAGAERNFGSKALAINAGYEKVRHLEHEFIGILDADVSFDPDYYAQIIQRFRADAQLGIAGGQLKDMVDGKAILQISNPKWSVSGPVQMFRKECFTAIGGYLPIRGGIDAAAEVMARRQGWKVEAFPELTVLHLRQTGKEIHGMFGRFFARGTEDYRLGYHPVFFFVRSLRRITEHPWILGALTMLSGYAWAALSRQNHALPADLVRYLRREQLGRLRAGFGFNTEALK